MITAETYSKLIHPTDRSLRTIFGDAGAATLIEADSIPSIWGMNYGTDGSGGDTLVAHCGGFRSESDAIAPRGRKRWPSELYMDGPSLINFTVGIMPDTVDGILASANMTKEQIKFYLMHQATYKMLEHLRTALELSLIHL